MKGRTYYLKSLHYIEEAEKILESVGTEDGYYEEPKIVKSAGRMAYKGVKKAAMYYIALNGLEIARNASDWEMRQVLYTMNSQAYYAYLSLCSSLSVRSYHHVTRNVKFWKQSLKEAREFARRLKQFKEPVKHEARL